jgi:FecR-like protein
MTATYSSADVAGSRGTRTAALMLGLVVGLTAGMGAAIGPAQAEKVGVAAAVNPDAFSSLSGTPNKQLSIGKNIFYSERINTTASGLVQVLLLDGSTFTVGPNSDLVIDKFVYDPKKKTGEMIATFSKGTMRFIGGKLSKNEGGVTVKTPSGALAIRGGMFQGSTSRGIYSFLYGHSLTFSGRNGQSQTIFQPGYTLDLSGGRANVRPTTPEDTNAFMQALSSQSTQFGTAGGTTNNPGGPGAFQDANNLGEGAEEAISDANTILVQTAIAQQLADLNNLKNNTPIQNTPDPGGSGTPDSGPPITRDGGTFEGFASGFLQTGENGSGEPQFLVDGTSKIVLDPEANSVTGTIKIGHLGVNRDNLPKVTAYTLGFYSDAGYTHDNRFLALSDTGSTSVIQAQAFYKGIWGVKVPIPHLGIYNPVNQHDGFIGNLQPKLCKTCDFLRYGEWVSDVQYGNNTDKMGGWWIGTNEPPVSRSDMPTQGGATYQGLAVGTFAAEGADQKIATGQMTMGWDFQTRKGDLDIKNFAGKNFGGEMKAPGFAPQSFGGSISGRNGTDASGLARGQFVGPRGGAAPAGVMGDFGVAGNNWKANGVFGGAVKP